MENKSQKKMEQRAAQFDEVFVEISTEAQEYNEMLIKWLCANHRGLGVMGAKELIISVERWKEASGS